MLRLEMNVLPKIAVIIPTLNSAATLAACLDSIAAQDYPMENIEVIFADGGSRDKTTEIIELFRKNHTGMKTSLVGNPLKTGEAGKAAGFKYSSHEIIAFIDSDNILDGSSWLKQMVEPFGDKDIVASEPIRYTYRATDGAITRYCALMGMNDPLCYFLGNYDRECILSGRWTEMPHQIVEDNSRYMKLRLDPQRMPTIGANGFFIRRQALEEIGVGDYLFDIDILVTCLSRHADACIAKTSIGIVHIFAGNLRSFARKQQRRIADFNRFSNEGLRAYPWGHRNVWRLFYFCFSTVFIAPLFLQTLRGFLRKRDLCWVLHPLFCAMTLWIYAMGTLLRTQTMKRECWQFA